MSHTVAVHELRVGMFVHLDLGWMAHPFPLSSFRITSDDQIETIRGLGLQRLRWVPEKSDLEPPQGVGAGTLETVAGDGGTAPDAVEAAAAKSPEQAAARRHREQLDAQREATRRCEKHYTEASRALREAVDHVPARPEQARRESEALTRALLDKMLVDGELCVRLLAGAAGDRATAHGLNVAVISLLMGRIFGLSADEMLDLGVGAMLHDVGKLGMSDRLRHVDDSFSPNEVAAYREHVATGVLQGKRMGLSAGALLVLAQHHENADGSGFPLKLGVDRMSMAARIVSIVNRYDNLCNPSVLSRALTPHEALSMLFAQSRSKFDATVLNAFIRMMGVYPAGSVVQLTDDRYALVVAVNSTRPLKPRVLVHDPAVPRADALILNLEGAGDLGIRRSLLPARLPAPALDYLGPKPRVSYFFEALEPQAPAVPREAAAA
jgi:HD-GYP domain-containing protein (c-di-GMP phosphodiesterase class II)